MCLCCSVNLVIGAQARCWQLPYKPSFEVVWMEHFVGVSHALLYGSLNCSKMSRSYSFLVNYGLCPRHTLNSRKTLENYLNGLAYIHTVKWIGYAS